VIAVILLGNVVMATIVLVVAIEAGEKGSMFCYNTENKQKD